MTKKSCLRRRSARAGRASPRVITAISEIAERSRSSRRIEASEESEADAGRLAELANGENKKAAYIISAETRRRISARNLGLKPPEAAC